MTRLASRTRTRRILAAGVSGVLLGLCFPTTSLVFLLPVALVPLVAALDGASPRAGFVTGHVFGIAFWLTTIPWIAYTVHRFGGMTWPLAVVALLITAVVFGLFFAVMGLLVALVRPASPLALFLTWPAAWVVQEGIRTYVLSGFPWSLISYPLAETPVLAQTAVLGGAALTSLLVVAVNAALAAALKAPGRRERAAWVGTAAAIAFSALGFGVVRLSRGNPDAAAPTTKVALIQPGVQQETRWTAQAREEIYVGLLEQTREVCRRERPDLVLWPESALPYYWPWSPRLQEELPALCGQLGVAILLNTVWCDDPGRDEAPYYNSALLVTASGPVLPPYRKLRLVPFGEYVPLAKLLTRIEPISKAVGSFTPGDRPVLIHDGDLAFGGAVCYEVVYPWIARAEVRLGADVLFTLTNDSWYGEMGAKRQHWQAAVFRAVETGRPMLRAAITGLTGAVDPWGRARLLADEAPGSLVVNVGKAAGLTPAVRLGDAPLAICAAAMAAGILRGRLAPSRRREEESTP